MSTFFFFLLSLACLALMVRAEHHKRAHDAAVDLMQDHLEAGPPNDSGWYL